jgi:hypothetical protein
MTEQRNFDRVGSFYPLVPGPYSLPLVIQITVSTNSPLYGA